MQDQPPREGCLSSFRLDQLVASELAPREARRAREHVASCEHCRARVTAVESEKRAFAAAPLGPLPPAVALGRTARSSSARRLVWAFAAPTLAAASIALWFAWPRSAHEPDDVRTKGNSHLEMFVERGGVVRAGGPGELVAPGDHLQFAYSCTAERFLAIVSVDAVHAASVYYGGATAERIPAGEHVALETSVALDETLGAETIYALFCARPIAIGPVVDALRARPERAPAIEGCEVEVLAMTKRAAR